MSIVYNYMGKKQRTVPNENNKHCLCIHMNGHSQNDDWNDSMLEPILKLFYKSYFDYDDRTEWSQNNCVHARDILNNCK